MLIEIMGAIFKCEEDKNIFFSRLYELPNYDRVITKGLTVHLSLKDTANDNALEEIQTICDIWGCVLNVLENDTRTI